MGGLTSMAEGFNKGYQAIGSVGDSLTEDMMRAEKYKEFKEEAPLREKERAYADKKLDYDSEELARNQDTMGAIRELSAFQSMDPASMNGELNAPALVSMYNKYWGPKQGFQATGVRGDGTGMIVIDGTDANGAPVSRSFSGDKLTRNLALSLDPKYLAEIEAAGAKNEASLDKSKRLADYQNSLATERQEAAAGRQEAAPTAQQKNINALIARGYTEEQATAMVYGAKATIDPVTGRTGAQTAAAEEKAAATDAKSQAAAKDQTVKAAEAELEKDYTYPTSTPEEKKSKYQAALRLAAERRGTTDLFPELGARSAAPAAATKRVDSSSGARQNPRKEVRSKKTGETVTLELQNGSWVPVKE